MTADALFDAPGPRTRRWIRLFNVVVAIVAAGVIIFVLDGLNRRGELTSKDWGVLVRPDVIAYLWSGLLHTLMASGMALVLSLIVGVSLGLGRLINVRIVTPACMLFVEFFRSVPVLLSMLFFFLGFPLELSALWTVVLALTLYNSAVISEAVRSGVLAVPRGQAEAAYAIGLRWYGSMRLVLLPQALRIMLPAIISQFAIIMKDSSLGFIVGYTELMSNANDVGLQFGNHLQMYVDVALVYIVMISVVSWVSNHIGSRQERKIKVMNQGGSNSGVAGSVFNDMAGRRRLGADIR